MVRSNRFNEGSLAGCLSSGLITRCIERIYNIAVNRQRRDEYKVKLIIDLGCEGGGARIFGRKSRRDETCTFWEEGCTIDLDENDNEIWKTWKKNKTKDIASLLPDIWLLMFPIFIYSEFVDWFRNQYDLKLKELPKYEYEMHMNHAFNQWQKIFKYNGADPLFINNT